MNTSNIDEKLLFRKKFDNGVELSCYERSRKLAVDRWLVRLHCETKMPVRKKYFVRYAGLPQDEIDAVREVLGSHITHTVTKERNFVDAEEKETALTELVKQVTDNMVVYVGSASFPEKFFVQQFEKYRKKLLLQIELERVKSTSNDEEDEPVDFSACFKD